MVTVYFEDSKVHPRLMNSAVRHSLWRFTKRHDAAFRAWSAPQLGQSTADPVCTEQEAHIRSAATQELPSDNYAPSAPSTQTPTDGDCCGEQKMQHGLSRGSLAQCNQLSYADVQAALHKRQRDPRSGAADMACKGRRAAAFIACAIFASRHC